MFACTHKLCKPSYESRNTSCILDFDTDYIPLELRMHSEGFELVAAAETTARSTITARKPIII